MLRKRLLQKFMPFGAVINLTFAGSVLLLGFITGTFSVKTTFQFSSTLIFLAFLYATFKRNDLQAKQYDQSLSNQSSNLLDDPFLSIHDKKGALVLHGSFFIISKIVEHYCLFLKSCSVLLACFC